MSVVINIVKQQDPEEMKAKKIRGILAVLQARKPSEAEPEDESETEESSAIDPAGSSPMEGPSQPKPKKKIKLRKVSSIEGLQKQSDMEE